MSKYFFLAAPALALFLSGCSLAPDYQRPEMDIPQTWEASQSQALQNKWWERFNDPTLNALVEEALTSNKNIAQAMARVEQAQAGLGVARDALLPTAGASLDGSRTGTRHSSGTIYNKQGQNRFANSFSGALAATWNLDFWGKYWNAAESARMDLVATEAARDNVILSVAAGTVESYFW
ncbi:MAG: TolC family protein, partial [Mailhella sp.]|nr:TolC family protein [Mailhella sp.]